MRRTRHDNPPVEMEWDMDRNKVTVTIVGADKTFTCADNWIARDVVEAIRDKFCFKGGAVEHEDGTAIRPTDALSEHKSVKLVFKDYISKSVVFCILFADLCFSFLYSAETSGIH